jgi:hypothetical protein
VQQKLNGVENKRAAEWANRLRVLHKSDHFLVVNKHEDLLFNSDERNNFRYRDILWVSWGSFAVDATCYNRDLAIMIGGFGGWGGIALFMLLLMT